MRSYTDSWRLFKRPAVSSLTPVIKCSRDREEDKQEEEEEKNEDVNESGFLCYQSEL
ncbi:hypothetical protein DPMN_194278 [Dreissena polymorpha]|uniref:Uncharacterized protein n=1 Tax=Dreissena polymorpha TaxID=45954 RepID=A0A9D3Y524_DREPO|nr:hypothetical protein DPMN_194278 [Dreissena polymorpha]